MKMKLLTVAFTIILVTALIGGFTMAWFTDSDSVGPAQFTAGTLLIDSGPIYPDPGELDYRWEEVNIFPERVVFYEQGTTAKGSLVKSSRRNPNAVLTLEDGNTDRNFFSLGFYMDETMDLTSPNPDAWKGRGGEVIVKFAERISAYDNCLVLVVEDTWGDWPEERAAVYVSKDGSDDSWVYVGDAINGLGTPQSYQTFNVDECNIDWFQYVKVVDKTDPCKDEKAISIWGRDDNDAFDLNAIMVRNMELARWNPGDIDLIGYYVRNVGNKKAYVRGTFAGSWYEQNEAGQWVPYNGDTNLVELEISEKSRNDWELEKVGNTDYYVYQYELEPGEAVELYLHIYLKGPETNNDYQGKRYILKGEFDAVQTTHGARGELWGF